MELLIHPIQLLPTILMKYMLPLHPTQEEQMSIRAYVLSENAPSYAFVQEWHNELCGMMPPKIDTSRILALF